VLELEKKSGRGYETFTCAGQPAGERERVRSHDDLTLRGSGAGFNTNIQQNIFLFIGDEQAPNGAKEANVEQTSNTEHRIQQAQVKTLDVRCPLATPTLSRARGNGVYRSWAFNVQRCFLKHT